MIMANDELVTIDGTKNTTFEELKEIIKALYKTGYKTPDFVRAIKEVLDLREVDE